MMSDSELLARFARTRSEDAFAELVQRYVNLVYSAALRQVGGDTHLAEDVAQTVFTDLARKATALARRPTLTGWLYTSARFAAAKIVRSEHRRRDREEEFMRQPNDAAPEADWEQLCPVLDEVMHQLQEPDREAILLRYFENRPFAEIGVRCGLNANAARMRVDRALEKLRNLLAKRGVTTTAALASVISAHAVQAAPASLAVTLATTSVACAGTSTLASWHVMNTTTLKATIGALALAGASTALLVQHSARQKLQVANESLTQQIAQLKASNQSLSKLPAQAQKPTTLPSDQFNELLRLRGEVGVLRQQTNELARLRQENRRLLSQLATQSAPTNQASAEDQFILRQTHVVDAMTTLLTAIKSYAANHNGQYPRTVDQLTASGAVVTSNFPGNLGPEDFQFLKDGAVDPSGNKVLLSVRVPLERPGRPSVLVLGGISPDGVTHTAIVNVSPDATQTSLAPNP